MKKYALFTLIVFISFGCKNKFEKEKGYLQNNIWVTISQNYKDYIDTSNNYEYEFPDEEKTIHYYTDFGTLFKYNYKGEGIALYQYDLIEDKRDLSKIVVYDSDNSSFLPLITNVYMELYEITGASMTTTRFTTLKDSTLINKINGTDYLNRHKIN